MSQVLRALAHSSSKNTILLLLFLNFFLWRVMEPSAQSMSETLRETSSFLQRPVFARKT